MLLLICFLKPPLHGFTLRFFSGSSSSSFRFSSFLSRFVGGTLDSLRFSSFTQRLLLRGAFQGFCFGNSRSGGRRFDIVWNEYQGLRLMVPTPQIESMIAN